MTRTLRQVPPEERERIISEIHSDAESKGWHELSNMAKGSLYALWEQRYNLTHATVKDQIMKGFDAAQDIPPSGEAAVQAEVYEILKARLPFVRQKLSLWNGRAQADFVLGFSRRFLTHTVELESAVSWRQGLMQALWYKSAYFQESQVQAIPTLILFGKVTAERWREIQTTCLDQRAMLVSYRLMVDAHPAPDETSLEFLLAGGT